MPERLLNLRDEHRRGLRRGLPSVCSSHPLVLRAAMDQALADGMPLLVGAPSDQVNHLAGFPVLLPRAYRDLVLALAAEAGLPPSRILLGGYHLGPGPWRHEEAGLAMELAGDLVEAFVAAGFRKLHLDARPSCQGDPSPLPEELAAKRTAALALRAEQAYAAHRANPAAGEAEVPGYAQPPVYSLDAEGSALGAPVRVTTPEQVAATLDLFAGAFEQAGAAQGWERMVALGVQPGVAFDAASVHPYQRKAAQALADALALRAPWMGEVHATDYQNPQALRALVEDGFGILNVGPWLTFACREALFALEDLCREMNQVDAQWPLIKLREALDRAMRRNPAGWLAHRRDAAREASYARLFSYNDRSRHYWADAEVAAEMNRLLKATEGPLPSQLLSLHVPLALDAVLDGDLEPRGQAIVLHAVRRLLANYALAARNETPLT